MTKQYKQFLKDVEESKPAVYAVMKLFLDKGEYILDVQDDEEYRKKDTDLLIVGDPSTLIEVKCDKKMSDFCKTYQRWGYSKKRIRDKVCLYIEVTDNIDTGKLGWLHVSSADYFYYIHYQKGAKSICHIFKLDELRELIDEQEPELKSHYDPRDDKYKEFHRIPISTMETLASYERIYLDAFDLNVTK